MQPGTLLTRENWAFEQLHELVDLNQEVDSDLGLAEMSNQLSGLLVALAQQTQQQNAHGVVAPTPEQRYEHRARLL